ncbi:carboxypeptidase regulatory-like domain-containing protein [Longimicrobium sp.]|uniref:carboxypeptidase regulatory-like domain-containing protein n=1 Tax=Longimicrobium sp. TaxID=2029185 RepID=UPI002BA97EA9|nr:carboxypeptidase regulatory-like domain-containing protein [Longimicrobium sp.]HSU17724.1 carboxypeptidase regulatory-like domain-containing protein [Longimicrobium sp.]
MDTGMPATIDDQPPPGDDPPVEWSTLSLDSITPVGGALAGGITATLGGSGFQEGAEVYFGSTAATDVAVQDDGTATATIPAAAQAGSVTVTVVNPDGSSSSLAGGYTYVANTPGQAAEVLGVTPPVVIEDTQSQITVRGRNLLDAYNNGTLALRGPARAAVNVLGFSAAQDAATGIDALTFTLRVTASPALQPLERLVIQVLASRRAGAGGDGVFESSRQMFTVLPKTVPVPLAFTPTLQPDQPTLVVVAGRNLAGATLDFGAGATVHVQKSDDRTLVGLVSLTDAQAASTQAKQLSVRSAAGAEVGRYDLQVVASSEVAAKASSSTQSYAVMAQTGPGVPVLALETVPGQRMLAPTESDSAVFSLKGGSPHGLFFDWGGFEIVLVDQVIFLEIINEVRLIPFFDGGGPGASDVPARVGTLVRVRGAGLLLALRVNLIVRIRVVLIVGFRYQVDPFGFLNEFADLYPWAIGSVVFSIRIEISVTLQIAALLAMVLPGGQLVQLASLNISIGVVFRIGTDGHSLQLGTETFRVTHAGIGPVSTSLLPCGGRFQLATDNGQTVFPDQYGNSQAYYFVRGEGACCLPWSFALQLVRFAPGRDPETVQQGFQADYCLTAAPGATLGHIVITSQDPEPEGVPPTLVMDLQDTALVRALAQPLDAAGNPTGPLQDVRDLGYQPEFYLEQPAPTVLDPGSLAGGTAFALLEGGNVIHVRLAVPDGASARLGFWPADVLGFDIARFVAAGLEPRVLLGSLPVRVRAAVTVEPVLTFRTTPTDAATLQVARSFGFPGGTGAAQLGTVWEMERFEPWETQRTFALGLRVTGGMAQNPLDVKVTVGASRILLVPITNGAPVAGAPLGGLGFSAERNGAQAVANFFGGALAAQGEVTVTLPAGSHAGTLVEVGTLTVLPYHREDPAATPPRRVAPGLAAADRHVLLEVPLSAAATGAGKVQLAGTALRAVVRSDENFEEYLRVLDEPLRIVAGSVPDIAGFAAAVYGKVAGAAAGSSIAALLQGEGKRLWDVAAQTVRAGVMAATHTGVDDRPLYWARLQAIAGLRAYGRRAAVAPDTLQALIQSLEWPSRGLEPDGRISLDAAPAGYRRVIVTGFDPFQLPGAPGQSNPSGVAALALNGPVTQTTPPVYIRTAVFPVRYAEFDQGLIETAVRPGLSSIVLLVTCSQNGGRPYYDIERWAGHNRVDTIDNNRVRAPGAVVAANLRDPGGAIAGGPQFLETTLPQIVTAREVLQGPNPAGNDLLFDQSYRVLNGASRPEPNPGDPAAYTRVADVPSGTADEGSGGNFLSNEIFYRTALVRTRNRPALPSGHFHVPGFASAAVSPPMDERVRLVTGTWTAIDRFLRNAYRLRISGNTAFPPTDVNTLSGQTLTLHNETGESVQIGSLEVQRPFEAPYFAGPFTLGPGMTVDVDVEFGPTAPGPVTATLTVRSTTGEPLAVATLTGEGRATFTISGLVTVDGAPAQGVRVMLSGSRTAEMATVGDGRYSFLGLSQGGSYTVTPVLAHYAFTPPSRTFASLAANQTGDFAGTVIRRRIAGVVRTATGTPLAGATVTLSGSAAGTVTTDGTGQYLFANLADGGSYTVSVSRPGYTFAPASQAFNNLAADTSFDFPGSAASYTITGQVTANGAALQGATVTLSGTQGGTATTDASGNYAFTVLGDGSYTVTPSRPAYTFTPSSASFQNVAASQSAAFTGTQVVMVRSNVASAWMGGSAVASSEYSSYRAAYIATNGDRNGTPRSYDPAPEAGVWQDGTQNQYPDWLEISFAPRAITEVDIYLPQDNPYSPAEITESLTFSMFGIQDFNVEYWTGSAWQVLPGGAIVNNDRVWRRIAFAPITTGKVRVVVFRGMGGWSRITELEVWSGGPHTNVASAAVGAVARASSEASAARSAATAINGDRRGTHPAGDPFPGGGWQSASAVSGEWLEVQFPAQATISEVSVFSVQDNQAAPAEPTEAMTFTQYGVQDFQVQYWTGSAWVRVPGGAVTNNDRVWRRIAFPPLTTDRVRVVVTRAAGGYSRIAQLEAWS